MKMFNKIIMGSEFDVNLLKTGVFYKDGVEAPVEDGAFVSIKGLVGHDLYDRLNDLNARKITAYDEADENHIYGFVDYVGVSNVDVMGVNYRIGDKTAGVYPSAGERIRVRIPTLADEFWLADENFTGDIDLTHTTYAAPENGKTTLAVSQEIAPTGFCVQIEDAKDLITGQVNEGSKLYRCRVVRV